VEMITRAFLETMPCSKSLLWENIACDHWQIIYSKFILSLSLFSELYHAWSGWRNRIIPPTSVVLTCLEYRKEKNPKFNEHKHQTSVLCIFNASYLSQKCSLPTLKSRSFAFIFQSWCFGTSGSIDVLK
jgi:hypothetical protein